jgi:hypothetical protein
MGKNEDGGARGSSAILGEYDSYIQIARGESTQKLKFDMRHTAPREELNIKFNPETFWFELADPNPLVKLVQECGELKKPELVKKMVEAGHFGTQSTVYNKVGRAFKSGLLHETETGTIILGTNS